MDFTPNTLSSNERSGTPLPSELLWATKKVKNKDSDLLNEEDQVMKEPKTSKISFKEMLIVTLFTRPKRYG